MSENPPDRSTRPMAELLRALGDDSRLRILALLRPQALCVCHIGDALALPQPNVSQHLRVLRQGGLVEAERRGSWVYYRLASLDPASARVVGAVLDGLLPEEDAGRLSASQAARSCP